MERRCMVPPCICIEQRFFTFLGACSFQFKGIIRHTESHKEKTHLFGQWKCHGHSQGSILRIVDRHITGLASVLCNDRHQQMQTQTPAFTAPNLQIADTC